MNDECDEGPVRARKGGQETFAPALTGCGAAWPRRRLLGSGLAMLGLAASPGSAQTPSRKKGWAGNAPAQHARFGVCWFYDWTGNGKSTAGVEFVPMVNNGRALGWKPLTGTTGPITALLGYNEPERADQGNLSVQEALAQWPRLVELARSHRLRLGSPAPSSDARGMAWLAEFMAGADRARLPVDFVALHWYRSRDAGAFGAWLDEMHRKFRRPLWLTEFNGWSGTVRENEAFLRRALRLLESNRHVERYAYFNPRAGHPCALLAADGSPTGLGKIYQDG